MSEDEKTKLLTAQHEVRQALEKADNMGVDVFIKRGLCKVFLDDPETVHFKLRKK